jgi:hypothetical protein
MAGQLYSGGTYDPRVPGVAALLPGIVALAAALRAARRAAGMTYRGAVQRVIGRRATLNPI